MAHTSVPESGTQSNPLTEKLRSRIKRGIELFASHGDSIDWVSEDRCKVPSGKHEGRAYLVVIGPDSERCVCPDFSRENLGLCKHTIAALISRSKRISYSVETYFDSRFGERYRLIENRYGSRYLYGQYGSAAEAYADKWAVEAELTKARLLHDS